MGLLILECSRDVLVTQKPCPLFCSQLTERLKHTKISVIHICHHDALKEFLMDREQFVENLGLVLEELTV
jgi:hypothetical protein